MLRYAAKRLIQAIPILLLVAVYSIYLRYVRFD